MSKNDANLPLFGGIAAAIGAGLCCVGPFLLLTLGIGGAWIGNLTLLEPYRPFSSSLCWLSSAGRGGKSTAPSNPANRALPARFHKYVNAVR